MTGPQRKERPIIFSGSSVRGILEDRKTVTRRVMKHQPHEGASVTVDNYNVAAVDRHGEQQPGPEVFGAWWSDGECGCSCPYGQPGDRLWVRETFAYADKSGTYDAAPDDQWRPIRPGMEPEVYRCWYRASDGHTADGFWKPSIHMPRWASRILLEITDVRVERLLDGEGETAFESRYIAEGIHRIHHGDGEYYYHPFKNEPGPGNWIDPFDAWRELWVSVNGAVSWNANPWVWVVEFRRIQP